MTSPFSSSCQAPPIHTILAFSIAFGRSYQSERTDGRRLLYRCIWPSLTTILSSSNFPALPALVSFFIYAKETLNISSLINKLHPKTFIFLADMLLKQANALQLACLLFLAVYRVEQKKWC